MIPLSLNICNKYSSISEIRLDFGLCWYSACLLCYLDWISTVVSTSICIILWLKPRSICSQTLIIQLIGSCDSFRLVAFNNKCKFLWVRSLHLAGTVTSGSVQSGGDIRPVLWRLPAHALTSPFTSMRVLEFEHTLPQHTSALHEIMTFSSDNEPNLHNPSWTLLTPPSSLRFAYLDLHRPVAGKRFRCLPCCAE